MNTMTEEFRGKTLRYSIISDNGILFNAFDGCQILGIARNQSDSDSDESCMDMEGVINTVLTGGKNRMSFVRWLEAIFAEYRWDVPIHPNCDDWQLNQAG